MQDRIPQFSNRYKFIPVSGQEDVYDLIRQDGATQDGTPLNKNSLLSDETAVLYGFEEDSPDVTPDKAFKELHRRTNWEKIFEYEYTSETATDTIQTNIPINIEEKNEIIILASLGYRDGVYEHGESLSTRDSYLGTNNNTKFEMNDSFRLFTDSEDGTPNFSLVKRLAFIPLEGIGTQMIGSFNPYEPTTLKNEEHINAIVLSSGVSTYQYFNKGAKILIYAR